MNIAPFVSIVIPVKNGAGRLEQCLQSLRGQTYPAERYEIIVADGRSNDATVDIARQYGCIVVDNPRQTVAGGRNVGIAAAHGEHIAFSEDDIVLPPNWIAAGVRALSDPTVGGVGGPTPIPPQSTPFARAVDMIFRFATMAGHSVQSGLVSGGGEVQDIPGGNAMYRRAALETATPMDEGLVTGEDVDLHYRIRAQGYKLVFCADFAAWHYKRDAPRRFFRQIRRFAQGRVQVGRRHKGAVRSMHWAFAVAPLIAVAVPATVGPGLAIATLGLGIATAVAVGLSSRLGIRTTAWLPAAVGIFCIAWSVGFFQELLHPTRDATGK